MARLYRSLTLCLLLLCASSAKGQLLFELATEPFNASLALNISSYLQTLKKEDIKSARQILSLITSDILQNQQSSYYTGLHAWLTSQLSFIEGDFVKSYKLTCEGIIQLNGSERQNNISTQSLYLALKIQLNNSLLEGYRNSGVQIFHHISKECISGGSPGFLSDIYVEKQQEQTIAYGFLETQIRNQRELVRGNVNPYLTVMALETEWFWHNLRSEHLVAEEYGRLGISQINKLLVKSPGDGVFLRGWLVDIQGRLSVSLIRQGKFYDARYFLQQNIQLCKQLGLKQKLVNEYFNSAYVYRMLGELVFSKRYYTYAKELTLELNQDRDYAFLCDINLGIIARMQGNAQEALAIHISVSDYKLANRYQYFEIVLGLELAKDSLAAKQYLAAKDYAGNILVDPRVLEPQRIDALLVRFESALGLRDNNLANNSVQILQGLLAQQNKYPVNKIRFHYLQLEQWLLFGGEEADKMRVSLSSVVQIINEVSKQADFPEAWIETTQQYFDAYISLLTKQLKSHFITEESKLGIVRQIFNILDTNSSTAFSHLRRSPPQAPDREVQSEPLDIIWRQLLSSEFSLVVNSNVMEGKFKESKVREARKVLDMVKDDFLAMTMPAKQTEDARIFDIGLDAPLLRLQKQEVLLRFYLGNRQSFLIFIWQQGKSIELIPLATKDEIDVWAKQLLPKHPGQRLRGKYAVSPLRSVIPRELLNSQSYSRIIWIPDGVMHRIPLGALNIATNERTYQPLISRFEVIRTHSARDYFDMRRSVLNTEPSHSSEPLSVALFADPEFDINKVQSENPHSLVRHNLYQQWRKSLADLPDTRVEVEAIAKLIEDLGGKVYKAVGKDATNDFLLSDPVRRANILHIATHGYFNPDTPDIVGLATSFVSSKTSFSSGFLSLSELLSKPFHNQLVLISGCETMLGEMYDGVGMNGLTHGLLARGAGGAMGTLWKVQERPTVEYQKLFYQGLVKYKGDIAKAMQMAALQLQEDGRFIDPKYWAGFVYSSSNKAANPLSM